MGYFTSTQPPPPPKKGKVGNKNYSLLTGKVVFWQDQQVHLVYMHRVLAPTNIDRLGTKIFRHVPFNSTLQILLQIKRLFILTGTGLGCICRFDFDLKLENGTFTLSCWR